ncbi:hypothetical protein Desti_4839 [Desulfomonile tiedjei DSM 6799]|uniref:Uncharacterized protein n=1 Tax=Desulfomonile tiedjei (strain ATCC 49306 / DSM 6799 / DCB-1) TaxID=706587 RepID=I4CD13_DESTA|nr:hypothetical protein Desti_4839 [Desulfomonile tiedjei DSM 6799]
MGAVPPCRHIFNMINDIDRMDWQGRRSPLISCIRLWDELQNSALICFYQSNSAGTEADRYWLVFRPASVPCHSVTRCVGEVVGISINKVPRKLSFICSHLSQEYFSR